MQNEALEILLKTLEASAQHEIEYELNDSLSEEIKFQIKKNKDAIDEGLKMAKRRKNNLKAIDLELFGVT